MPDWLGFVLGGALAITTQMVTQTFMVIRSRSERQRETTGAARIVRDDVISGLEVLHYTITNNEWWPDSHDNPPSATVEDRRMLAARADGETTRRTFGSLRRYRQLRNRRSERVRNGGEFSEDDLTEAMAVFLDLAKARQLLASVTGYRASAREPYHGRLALPAELLPEALRRASLPNADGLYSPANERLQA